MNDRNVFKDYCSEEDFAKLVPLANIVELLEKVENEYSEKVAVITNDGNVTYQQLCSDTKAVVAALKANEVIVKTNVGVIGPNNYNFTKAALGAMAYGCVATLLPVQLDEKTIYGCCMKYNLTVLLYDESVEAKVQFAKNAIPNVKFIKIVDFKEEYGLGEYNPNIEVTDSACIVMTGGTTGRSKGAVLSHRALMTGVLNGTYGVPDIFDQVYYSIMPLTHVFGFIRNLLTCFYTGSSIFFAGDRMAMFKEIQKVQPTILIVVPALAEIFLNLTKQFGLKMLGGKVKTIICGGASVSPYIVTEFREFGVNCCPGYGLTESANLVSGNPNPNKPTSVGIIYPDLDTKVVNGELWLKGPNMMDGYYNEPEENANAFEDGWFKTGDLVRFDEEGYLYITGRIKDIIVLANGENVSPAYLEDKLNEMVPVIQDSLVYDDVNEYGAEQLIVEVTLRPALVAKLGEIDIQKYMEERLEEFNKTVFDYEKISKIIIRKEDFPRTASMKIIRKKRALL